MGGRGEEENRPDRCPSSWESDFIVTSQALSRHVWDICSVPGMSQGHGALKAWPTGSSPPPKKGTPSKGRREDRFLANSQNSQKHE